MFQVESVERDKLFLQITSSAILTEFLSPQEIINMPEEDLLAFLAQKSRNRLCDLSKTSELLRKAARDSYRLDKCMYEPLNISLASSFNCIQVYQKEIKLIEQAIEKCIKGMPPNALTILRSIPGIGPVWASGILSEIGDITVFHSSDALAKYAGLYWPKGIPGSSFLRITICRKLGIPIFATILAKRQTASGSTSRNTLTSMPENMLRYPNISTKEHSCKQPLSAASRAAFPGQSRPY